MNDTKSLSERLYGAYKDADTLERMLERQAYRLGAADALLNMVLNTLESAGMTEFDDDGRIANELLHRIKEYLYS